MEVRFSEALPLEKTVQGGVSPNTSRPGGNQPPITVVPNSSSGVAGPNKSAEGEQVFPAFTRETVAELVKRSAELLSTFDRQLKYEVKEDAGVVQVQVIDPRDGRVVRKVPADEVIKFLEHIKNQIDDRVDVLA